MNITSVQDFNVRVTFLPIKLWMSTRPKRLRIARKWAKRGGKRGFVDPLKYLKNMDGVRVSGLDGHDATVTARFS